jgi:type IV pilus assembly protein PilC
MATYTYTARDKGGTIHKGSVFAGDQSAAAANLIDKGLVPILIKAEGAKTNKSLFSIKQLISPSNHVKLKDKVIFSRQFATMINAGVPITQALGILQEQTSNKHFQKVIADCAKQVEGGAELNVALSAHPEVFSVIYINMVKAGETGGMLDEVLERLAVQQEKDAEIVSKVRSALIYPAILLFVTIGAFVFLMTYLVPRMAVIFQSLGSNLPWYSALMLQMSNFLVHYGIFILVAVIAAGIFLFRFSRTPHGKHLLDSLLVRAPIIGPIIIKVNVARFARTFGSLMSSGLSVLESLNTTADGLNNSVFQDALREVAKEVKAGKNISEPLKHMQIFPPIVGQMLAVGEETGKLDDILIKLATFYEKEVDTVVSVIASVIDPVLIVVLGGIVGFIVIGVYGPLSQLNNAV